MPSEAAARLFAALANHGNCAQRGGCGRRSGESSETKSGRIASSCLIPFAMPRGLNDSWVIARFAGSWNRFWFEADGRTQIRIFRLGFGLLLLACYLIRTLDFELFYGQSGLMPLSILTDVAPMQYRFSVFHYLTSDAALWIGNGFSWRVSWPLRSGYRPRVTVIVAWALHLSFVHRNLSIAYGVDMISCFFLFFLCFADYREDREYRPGDLGPH